MKYKKRLWAVLFFCVLLCVPAPDQKTGGRDTCACQICCLLLALPGPTVRDATEGRTAGRGHLTVGGADDLLGLVQRVDVPHGNGGEGQVGVLGVKGQIAHGTP